MSSPDTSGGTLSIDLDALAGNWRLLDGRLEGAASCAAAIKADAYGLGAGQAVPALAAAGCRHFFAALPDEGIAIRRILDAAGRPGEVHVLCGIMPDGGHDLMAAYVEHRLSPVLNSLAEIAAWKGFVADLGGEAVPMADIHVDTGMLRLGLPPSELARLAENPALIRGFAIGYVISHLAVSDEPGHSKNPEQLAAFRRTLQYFPGCKASLANSSAIFLGPEYRFDLVRPGVALYGANPTPDAPNPMMQVVQLQGKILQVRDVDTPQTVGYGASHRIAGPGRIATLGIGYADGYPRALGNNGFGFIGGRRVALVGRVSMDLTTFDVTGIPEDVAHPGAMVELIGPNAPIDEVAAAAGTIAYEILTGLGPRFHRRYSGGGRTR